LDGLNADGFTVPEAIAAFEGEPIIAVAVPEVPEQRNCTLLTWIAGPRVRKQPTPKEAWRIGYQIVRLHRHASGFPTPNGFTRPSWDPDSLVDHSWHACWRRLSSSRVRLTQEIADRFQSVAADLGHGNEVFGLIHGDFTFENVLFDRGEARVIDFDDCGRGYFLYDIATLLDRMEWNGERIIWILVQLSLTATARCVCCVESTKHFWTSSC
jgi:Ser/Thr protein kinase RdoA (MazF antagonist)